MFIIEVKKEDRNAELDYGYAKISQYSRYLKEEEVLFNPLNTFLIDKIGKTIIKSTSEV